MDFLTTIAVGRLGRDPEMRFAGDGTPVTSFSLAVKPYKTTIWLRVSAWGKLAEPCNQYLEKGQQVTVEGVLKPDPETGGPRIWTGSDGKARASYDITAHKVEFGDKAGGREAVESSPEPEEDEDIPF